ncbi:MAG: hypothetical protein ACKOFW_24115 [Planctomycetaceae bacterium]
MRGFRWLCLMVFVATLGSVASAGRVEAGMLALRMSGETFQGASFAGTLFADDTPWSLVAEFDSADLTTSGGVYGPLSSLTVVVGTTTYTAVAPDTLLVYLSSVPGIYYLGIADSSSNAIVPQFLVSSDPNWSASNPTPTVFSNFAGIQSLYFTMATSNGLLILATDEQPAVQASITAAAVPEPSLVSLAAFGAVCGLVVARRRALRA